MLKRDVTKLQTVAAALDELTQEIETKMRDGVGYAGNNVTMVVDSSNKLAMTLFAGGSPNMNQSITVMVNEKHIQKPAYAALAFRMAMIRLNEPDAGKRPPAFSDMLPDVIGELYFLQDFILMTFSQETDMAADVEFSGDGSGLINALLLTTVREGKRGNTYRTKVSESSLTLRSNTHYFDLFDGVRNGSVLAMLVE